jgi:alkyl sulfatase BDS1-like metallo-beta-lactamase superfamily hydrolase
MPVRKPDLQPVRVATRAFVRAVGRAQSAGKPAPEGLRRRLMLATVFRAMPRRLDRRRARGVDAAVEWRITDAEGGVDIWTLTIADGHASVRRGGAERPRTRIELSTGDFLALATGHANGPELLFDGRLQLEGDMLFAGSLATMFRVPRAA